MVQPKVSAKPSSVKLGVSGSPLKKVKSARRRGQPFGLLGAVQQHVLGVVRPKDAATRRKDVLHPSDLAKSDWCARAAYWQLQGREPQTREYESFVREQIFAEGHDIHSRFQGYLWEMGILSGEFKCLACSHVWWATSPEHCPKCQQQKWGLRYEEVPASCPELSIEGHADGLVPAGLVEFKSFAKGTLRWEAPELLKQYTYKVDVNGQAYSWFDMEGMWANFHKPFPGHLRQVMIYLYCMSVYDVDLSGFDMNTVIFIYQNKWNQDVKMFTVKYDFSLIKDRIEGAKIVTEAMAAGEPPACQLGGCKACQNYEGGTDAEIDDEGPGVLGGTEPGSPPRARRGRVLIRPSRSTRVSLAYAAKAADGTPRRQPNGLARRVQPVGRPHRRPALPPGD